MKVIQNLKDGTIYAGYITGLVALVILGATALSAVLG